MLNAIGLLLPCNLLEGVMRTCDDLVASSEIRFFIFKHIVTDSHDHGFVEIWPSSKHPLADMVGGDGFGRPPLSLGGGDGDDHTLISRIGLEDVDSVVAECTVVWQSMERWETGKGACTNTDTLNKTEDEINTVAEGGEVEWRSSRSGMSQIGEEARLGRGVVLVAVFVKCELSAQDSRLVPSFLFVGQADIPSCCQSRIIKMTYEPWHAEVGPGQ